jgi:hypothetical protein
VAIPEKRRMPTSVHVEVIPTAEEYERVRSGMKAVGMILIVSVRRCTPT